MANGLDFGRITHEVNTLLYDGMDSWDAVSQTAQKYNISFEAVTKAYKAEFGMLPEEFNPEE